MKSAFSTLTIVCPWLSLTVPSTVQSPDEQLLSCFHGSCSLMGDRHEMCNHRDRWLFKGDILDEVLGAVKKAERNDLYLVKGPVHEIKPNLRI